MNNTDPTKNYNGWETRTQRKTTMCEQHGHNQKLPIVVFRWVVSLIHCSFWLGPCRSSIVVFGWGPCCSSIVVHDSTKDYNGWATRPNLRLQWMSNTDLTKDYNRWATRTQPKTTIDEQHGPNQKLQWMGNTDPTKNYNGSATRTQPLLIYCSFWLGPCCTSIVVFGWVRVAEPL
jgi:hypothetical protein